MSPLEPDFATAAEAWIVQQMTIAAMEYRNRLIALALEYARRLQEELAASGGQAAE